MFTTAHKPPYTAVIFTSVRPVGETAQVDGYSEAAQRMDELAREQPGFLGNDSVRDENGYGITVSYWKDEHSARAWKQVQEHLHAQSTGRKKWYKNYSVHVATVNRAYSG
ncbi:antibiotic biosynthesis monooxygenase [Rothia amarae]|uniref:antibiotic biosynthesis monooxygenase family protein n=1 Tax=Rothia amarae TaxID=169480 RepID=UPI0031D85778